MFANHFQYRIGFRSCSCGGYGGQLFGCAREEAKEEYIGEKEVVEGMGWSSGD
jgi:hypothetical protein